jgi:hypothetical protein
MLEPEGELAGVAGYHSIQPVTSAAAIRDDEAAVIDVFRARRRMAEATLDTERWLDDGGTLNELVLRGDG